MKVLFIFCSWNSSLAYSEGVGVLSACLKRAGHETKLLYIHKDMHPFDLEKIKAEVLDFDPGLVALSTCTNQFQYVTQISGAIRSCLSVPIIAGGVHPTLCTEDVAKTPDIDILCVGEGEQALVELASALDSGTDITPIRNLWVKNNGQIHRNAPRPYQGLDEIPFSDRSIFDFQRLIDLKNGWVDMMAGRGCPYLCTYCWNESYRKIYKKELGSGSGSYIRFRKPTRVVSEIKEILGNYENIKTFSFNDDTFTLSKRWLAEFCSLYKKEVDMPFVINSHLNNIEDDVLDLLREAGCELIRIGIESGNARIRKEILKRHAAGNKEVADNIRRIKERGIRVLTYNMIGLPTETKEDVLDTIKLNAQCAPDVIKILTFYPYKNTPIYDFCVKHGFLDPDHDELPNYYEGTVLNFDKEMKDLINDVQANFCRYLNDCLQEKGIRYEKRFTPYFAVKVEQELSEEIQSSLKGDLL